MNKIEQKFKDRFDEKLVKPLLSFLKQGISPEKLALCVSLGAVCGLFPIVGITTILCLIVSLALRLNVAVMQLVNYIVYPLQLVVLIPLIAFGSYLLGGNPFPYDLTEILDLINRDFVLAVESLWIATLYGIVGWLVLATPMGLLIYLITKTLLLKMARKPSAD